jgi:hypothetical protein
MRCGRVMRMIIANIIVLVFALGTFALMLFLVFGFATLIRDLPGLLSDLILMFAVLIGFGSYFLVNYLVLKFILRKFKVRYKDIIQWDA